MAQVKFNSKQIEENLTKKFDAFKTDEKSLNDFGERLVVNIKADARAGLTYTGKAFPSLSPEWVKRKNKLADKNNGSLDRFYKSGKSNVTFFGDLLRGLYYKVKGGKLVLGFKGKHQAIIGVRGKVLEGSRAKLSDIYDGLGLIDNRYKFVNVSEASELYLKDLFVKYLRRKK